MTEFAYNRTVGVWVSRTRSWWANACRQGEELLRQAQEARRRAEAEAEQRRFEEQMERERPQRELAASAEAEAQRRREIARANCLVLYGLHAADIKERFSREMLDPMSPPRSSPVFRSGSYTNTHCSPKRFSK